jgi:hypothetical protein
MEFVNGNTYTVNELHKGDVHVFKVTWVGKNSIDVRVMASTSFNEHATMEIKTDSLRWMEQSNWFRKSGTNLAYQVEVALTDHHKNFFIDLALATKDWEWLKQLKTMEVVQ